MAERLTLCMVVRDEEQDLPRCLDSVRALVNEIVIVDTGSRDQTVAIAQRYGAIVRTMPWQNDFSMARNVALDLATGDWVLVLDADEALLPDGRHALPLLLADTHTEGYFLTLQNLHGSQAEPQYQCDPVFRLFRNRPLYRFVGAVHEQILSVIQMVNPEAAVRHSPLRIIHYGYLDEYMQARGKGRRNLRLLQAHLTTRPGEPFLLYNLGLEQVRAGSFRQALRAFAAAHAHAPLDAPWRPALLKWYANALYLERRTRAALELLAQGRAQYPDYTDLHYLAGTLHGALGEWDEAIHCFDTCRSLGPAPCPPYSSTEPELGASKADYSLGRALQGAGRHGEAQAAYLKAATARPGWMPPLQQLARLLATQGDDDELVRVLEGQFPSNAEADRVIVALLLVHAGRYQPALDRLAPMVVAGQISRSAGYVYALALAKLRRCEEALAVCRQRGWHESDFVPKITALTLYCCLCMGDGSSVRELTADRKRLPSLYTDLAGLLWDESEAELARFVRALPRSYLLTERVAQERQAAW